MTDTLSTRPQPGSWNLPIRPLSTTSVITIITLRKKKNSLKNMLRYSRQKKPLPMKQHLRHPKESLPGSSRKKNRHVSVSRRRNLRRQNRGLKNSKPETKKLMKHWFFQMSVPTSDAVQNSAAKKTKFRQSLKNFMEKMGNPGVMPWVSHFFISVLLWLIFTI